MTPKNTPAAARRGTAPVKVAKTYTHGGLEVPVDPARWPTRPAAMVPKPIPGTKPVS